MFLRAGCVPEAGLDRRRRTLSRSRYGCRACSLRRFPCPSEIRKAAPGIDRSARCAARSFAAPRPEQGLLIAKHFYLGLGGHPETADPETALLRRIGRRRLALLAASISTRD